MRAFEKKYPRPTAHPEVMSDGASLRWCMRKEGFRAALEWAMEQGSVNNYNEIRDELEDD